MAPSSSAPASFVFPDAVQAYSGLVVVLLRHGRTAWNAEQRFLGRSDVPLDAVGESQVAPLGAALAGCFDAVYSSPLLRAMQTARAVTPDPVPLSEVMECDLGELEGTPSMDAMRTHPEFLARWGFDPGNVPMPGGGETLGQVQERGLAAVRGLRSAHPSGRVLVVTHQLVIASVACAAAGIPLSRWRKQAVGNAQMTALGVSDDERIELLASRLQVVPDAEAVG